MARLSLHELSVVVDGTRLLAPVSHTLSPGSTRLAGPSGCGKSSLLRVLSNLSPAASGQVQLDGQTANTWGVPAYRRRVVFLPQRPAFQDETLMQALERPFAYTSATTPFDVSRATALLERLGLGHLKSTAPVMRLSEGERQRVGLVRALLIDPQVLLADEPVSALDEAHQDIVCAVLEQRVQAGLTLLVVSHQERLFERLPCQNWSPSWQRVEQP